MNIDYEKNLEHMENIKYDYRGYIQKIMILKVNQQIVCEMLIGGKKLLRVICLSESLISG